MIYIIFFALFLYTSSIIEDIIHLKFSEFKKTYNKNYIDKYEEKARFDIFKKNFQKYGYIHKFSDVLDREQSIRILTTENPPPSEYSWQNYMALPKHQKGCGFCYVFSYISQVEAQFRIKYGKKYRFSEQELLDCSGELTCKGTNFHAVTSFIQRRGFLTLENKYNHSYTGIKDDKYCQYLKNKEILYSSTVKLNIEPARDFDILRSRNRKECMKSLLVKHGPIGASIFDGSFIENYRGDIIYSENGCDRNAQKKSHALTIVGYEKDKNNQDIWIIRNSYGTDWGEGGYLRMLAGKDICGIESNISVVNVTWNSWCGKGCDNCYYNSQIGRLTCTSCIKGYYYDNNLKMCYKCIDGCYTCSNSYSCSKCGNKYYLLNNKCLKCARECKKCTGPTPNQCTEWYVGQSLDSDDFSEEEADDEPNEYLDDEIELYCSCEDEKTDEKSDNPGPLDSKYLDSKIILVLLGLLLY